MTTAPLNQAPARASALARLLAHDARTPLNAIRGFAELMLAGAAGPLTGDALEYLAQIARAGRAIEDALRLTQELAELEDAAPDPARTPVDLGPLLDEAGFAVEAGGRSGAPLVVLGSEPAWRRVCRACGDYLAGSSAPGAGPPVALGRATGAGGLELRLRRPDMRKGDGTRMLEVELARRIATGQGGRLALDESDGVEIGGLCAASTPESVAGAWRCRRSWAGSPAGCKRVNFLLDFQAAAGTAARTTGKYCALSRRFRQSVAGTVLVGGPVDAGRRSGLNK